MKMDPDAKKSVTKVVGTCLNTILTKFGTSNMTYVVTVRLNEANFHIRDQIFDIFQPFSPDRWLI